MVSADPWADLRGVPLPIRERCGRPTQKGTPCQAERSECGWHGSPLRRDRPKPAELPAVEPSPGPGDEPKPYRYTSARLRHLNGGSRRVAARSWDGPPDDPPDGGEPLPEAV